MCGCCCNCTARYAYQSNSITRMSVGCTSTRTKRLITASHHVGCSFLAGKWAARQETRDPIRLPESRKWHQSSNTMRSTGTRPAAAAMTGGRVTPRTSFLCCRCLNASSHTVERHLGTDWGSRTVGDFFFFGRALHQPDPWSRGQFLGLWGLSLLLYEDNSAGNGLGWAGIFSGVVSDCTQPGWPPQQRAMTDRGRRRTV